MSNFFEMPQKNSLEKPVDDLILEKCHFKECEIGRTDEFIHGRLQDLKDHHLNSFLHTVEVANIMAFVVNKFGDRLDDYDKNVLMMSAFAHDFGKVTVNKEILDKREKLTTEERSIIKKHPRAGFDLIWDWNEDVARVVVAHHEFRKEDSYPRKSNRMDNFDERIINIKSIRRFEKLTKILALVDSFEAMNDPTRPRNKDGLKSIDEIIMELSGVFSEDKDRDLAAEVIGFLYEYYYKKQQEFSGDKNVWN